MKVKYLNKLISKNVLMISFLTVIHTLLFSQVNYLYLGNNKYPASDYLEFQDASKYERSIIYVRFATSSRGAYIELTQHYSYSFIKGSIKIFLEDGNYIMCFDYGKYDEVNRRYSTIYKLTKEEMLHLTSTNIDKIRFDEKGSGNFALTSFDYLDKSELPYKTLYGNIKTAEFIKNFYDTQNSNVGGHDYNALFGAAIDTKPNDEKIKQIKLKPNNVEAGRKFGNRREPEISGQINTMTIVFNRNTVRIYDDVEQSIFNIVGYEWMNDNKLWIDFSAKPLEFYMVIVFDIDGLVFVNDENDPQPGEQYKSLYFKELNKAEFHSIYK